MELNVGKLITKPIAPNPKAFEKLHSAFIDINNDSFHFDYKLTRDKRFKTSDWETILKNEILLLYNWTLKRFIYSRKKEIPSSPKFKYNHIYCLQPRYAVTLHIFRRVLPFAILNLKTSSVFHKNLKSKATEISDYLTSCFSLQPIPVLTKEEATLIPDLKNNLIVLTGKESTFCLLKNKYHNLKIIGSLGTSSIVLARDIKQGKLFLEKQAPLKQSCTNISSVIIPKLKPGSKTYYDTSDNLIYTFKEIWSKYNPTIIHDISNHFKKSDVKKSGYCITQHQDEGLLSGICADPIHGYSGDYTL